MKLEDYGWSPHFAEAFAARAQEGLRPGRVAAIHRDECILFTEHGEMRAETSGRLRFVADESEWPAAGDWALYRAAGADFGLIESVLPRRSAFTRNAAGREARAQVLAANIDVAFLVSGLDADFNPRRIERYVYLAWESGAAPVIVLNKADLHPSPDDAAQDASAAAPGVPVISLSARSGEGMGELISSVAPRQTAALLGSSGVGKSTIVNRLLGHERQQVSEVRASDQRGCHTTALRELIPLPCGWLLLDMPGLRELQLRGGSESLDAAFEDIRALASGCRYRDCAHAGEPGCAVRGAVSDARLESYHRLGREIAYQARREDESAARAEKQRWARIHRSMKQIKYRW